MFCSDDVVGLAKALLCQPAAFYISGVEKRPEGTVVRGGAIVRVGDDNALKAAIEAGIKQLALSGVENVELAGQTWQRLKPSANVTIVWGFRGRYFLIALGEGEIEALTNRAKGEPPDWLATLRQDFPIERFSTVAYANVKAIMRTVAVVSGPQTAAALSGLGLDNVTAIRAATGLDQDCFVSRMLLAIDGPPQGLFQLIRAKPLSTEDFAAVPRNANYVLAAKLNVSTVFDAVVSVLEKSDPFVRMETIGAMTAFEQAVGIRLREDVFQSLGDTWLLYDAPGAGSGAARGVAVNVLRSPDKFAEAYKKIMGMVERGVPQPPPEEKDAPRLVKTAGPGGDIYSAVVYGEDSPIRPSICLTGKELLVALAPAAISSRQSPPTAEDSLAAVPLVLATLNVQPEPIFLSYINMPGLLDQLYPALPDLLPKVVEQLLGEGVGFDVSALPSAEAVKKHLMPDIAVVRPTSSGVMLSERSALPGIGVASSPLAFVWTLPSTRDFFLRNQSAGNMGTIAAAMRKYAQANQTLPPAYKADKDGKPLLSWRVLLLPYLQGGDIIYRQFHLDEPWDSEHNKKLMACMPAVYRSPKSKVSGEGKTNYLTPRGEKSLFPGAKGVSPGDIPDGAANTIMLVEACDESAVPWTKPDDFEYSDADPMGKLLGMWPDGFLAVLADDTIMFLKTSATNAEGLVGAFTRNGGENVRVAQVIVPSPLERG